jgi:hypothetical protein
MAAPAPAAREEIGWLTLVSAVTVYSDDCAAIGSGSITLPTFGHEREIGCQGLKIGYTRLGVGTQRSYRVGVIFLQYKALAGIF